MAFGANDLLLLPEAPRIRDIRIEGTSRLSPGDLKKVVSIMSDNTAVYQSVLSAYLQSCLSMCLQSQISQAIVTRAQHINSGRCNQNNYDFSLSFISSFPTLG